MAIDRWYNTEGKTAWLYCWKNHIKTDLQYLHSRPIGHFTIVGLVPWYLSECEAEVDTIKPPSFSYKCIFCWKKNYLHKNNMIYKIKKEGLYQKKVDSSLDYNCKIGYYCFPF